MTSMRAARAAGSTNRRGSAATAAGYRFLGAAHRRAEADIDDWFEDDQDQPMHIAAKRWGTAVNNCGELGNSCSVQEKEAPAVFPEDDETSPTVNLFCKNPPLLQNLL
jgi:hypothetical protein